MNERLVYKSKDIDVLFIAEGTYPFVRGGVSTWIHQIITGMEEINFGVLFLGSRKDDYEGIKYELPKNLLYLETLFLFEDSISYSPSYIEGSTDIEFLTRLLEENCSIPEDIQDVRFFNERVKLEDLLYGKYTWHFMEDLYIKMGADVPFKDFFWTIRNILYPLWTLIKGVDLIQDIGVNVIHSPSTGYAGLLGTLLKKLKETSLVITEHGIYTRERKIDILNSKWIKNALITFSDRHSVDCLKKIWVNFFINIGKICYKSADLVLSLFEGARQCQIDLGCPPSKAEVVPNGVDIEKYKPLRTFPNKEIPKVVALIGRVTPIKDVKTFIKAMKLLANEGADIEGWIIGPEDEDPVYANECKMMVKVLGLESKVKFKGFKKLEDIFPNIGITTLTSISEGMPLVILESFAAGIPCVTTDVGSCKQLIYGGLNEEDINIGKAGFIVPVGSAKELAKAYKTLLNDRKLWYSCGYSAIERVEKFYSYEKFLRSYKNIYRKFMEDGLGRDTFETTKTFEKG